MSILLLIPAGLLGAAPELPSVFVTLSSPPAVVVNAAATCLAHFKFTVAEGFHVQANPASEPQYIATHLKLNSSKGVRPGAPVYPPGRPLRFKGASKELSTYEGDFEISVPLTAPKKAWAADGMIEGTLRYQACDERNCFFPESIPVRFLVRVMKSAKIEASGLRTCLTISQIKGEKK